MDYEKSPCLHCTKVAEPEQCTNMKCAEWKVWWLAAWAKIHRDAGTGCGPRMAEEVKRVCEAKGMMMMQFAHSSLICGWRYGKAPSCPYLAKLSLLGGDVAYVLTGKRGCR